MKFRKTALITALAISLLVPASAEAKVLVGSGSTAAQPYFQALFAAYRKVKPSIRFKYNPDGGNSGVKDVQQGVSQFAGQSRAPLPSDAGTTYVKLFLDALCVDVNPANSLSNVSLGDLANVYTGTVTNWSGVPGSNLNTTIDAFGRDSTAGTFTFFTQAVLNGASQGSNVTTQASDGLVANAVKQDANGIGYIGLAYQGAGLRTLSVGGVPCVAGQVRKLAYPLSRYIWLVLPTGNIDKDVAAFADWVRTSYAAGVVINAHGGVSAFNATKPPRKKKH